MKLARPVSASGHIVPDAARDPDAVRGKAPRASGRRAKIGGSLEDDLLGTCGGLLGSVEALACELPLTPPPRTARALEDARYYGQRMRDHVEALAILALPELEASTQPVSFAVARWLDHACRGAAVQLGESGCTLVWPAPSELAELQVMLAVSRMDRALTVMLEQLALAAGQGASLRVDVASATRGITLTLSARAPELPADVGGVPSHRQPLSALFLRAWERLCAWHHGAFRYNPDSLTIVCELPRPPGTP